MRCLACNSVLSQIEYQARSADEAHRNITVCPNCPVDVSSVLSSGNIPPPPPRFSRGRGHVRANSSMSKYSVYTDITTVSILVSSDHPSINLDGWKHHIVSRKSVLEKDNALPSLGLCCIQGPLEGKIVVHKESKSVGIRSSVAYSRVYSTIKAGHSVSQYCIGKYLAIGEIENFPAYLYYENESRGYRLMVVIKGMCKQSTISSVVSKVYSKGYCPKSLTGILENGVSEALANLGARAWDVSLPPSRGYKFTSKPDGERRWMVLSGCFWYMVKCSKMKEITGWLRASGSPHYGKAIIVDTEYMAVSSPILIDMLTDSTGKLSPIDRDIDWVLKEFSNLGKLVDTSWIMIRPYFENYDNVVDYCSRVSYPIDGIVAIHDGEIGARKIKDIKSMELRLAKNGVLCTEDGVEVIGTTSVTESASEGDIFEIRFSMNPNDGKLMIKDCFLRTDKDKANSVSAVHQIISSASTKPNPGENERRSALLWCNSLRASIVNRVSNMTSSRSIVMDVGTGTGQSLDSFEPCEHTSYIFVEPNMLKCKSIARRLNVRSIMTSPSDIISKIKPLKTRSIKHCIVNCTLGQILSHNELSEALIPELRAILCTFSIHFIVDDLYSMSSKWKVPIYGCTYAYDGVQVGNNLIDECGVLMKRVSEDECSVRWGRDKEYIEPYTVRNDYAALGTVVPASSLQPLPVNPDNTAASDICSKVIVIEPRF